MNRTSTLLLLLLVVGLTSCATQPLYLVNAFDNRESCQPSAKKGLLGKIFPNKIADDCKKALTQMGYLPESEAGIINIELIMDGADVVAASLPDEALQQQPDLETGDKIMSINGQQVENIDATTAMLFGTVGSKADVIFGRGTIEFPVQLTRQPINGTEQSSIVPEVTTPSADAYSMANDPTGQEPITANTKHTSILNTIKNLFSSMIAPHGITTTERPSNATQADDDLSNATQDNKNAAEEAAKKDTMTQQNSMVDHYSQPIAIAAPPPLIMVGDQVCRMRKHFIDIGNVEDKRANQILVVIDHIQLIRPPYSEFDHFNQERLWSPITIWRPCSGESPVFMHKQ